MKSPLVSIVIPTHNRQEMVSALLESILNSTYKNIEIIVVDDASNDNTNSYLHEKFKRYKKIQIIRNKKNLYTAGSRNVGFRHAKGDFIFFIDDDNILDKNAISELIGVFLEDAALGELGPVNYSCLNKKKILWARTRRDMNTTRTYQARSLKEFGSAKTWETDDVLNAFMVRASVVRPNSILFREKFGIMYEESDYAYRIRKLGYNIKVVRSAKIYHAAESITPEGKIKDYMFHFMNDKRRPFVFARNRIIFHSMYSSKFQMIGIIAFWIWFFTLYYLYKILFYSGVGNFSVVKRITLAFQYLKGDFVGISFILNKQALT